MDDARPIIYQAESGAIELPIDAANETIWATQKQIADIFEVNVPAINKHITNILSEEEVDPATISNKEIVQDEGGRQVRRTVSLYSLDMIIAIGYRVTTSARATAFRKWATKTLRSYITDGFVINPQQLERNKSQFTKAIEDLKLLSEKADRIETGHVSDLVLAFANTWFSLDAYDKSELPSEGNIKQLVDVSVEDLKKDLTALKTQLISNDEATDIFGQERIEGGLAGLFGNVLQSFAGQDMYPTLEEKAAHLLYFTVKNHVFVDGNKRSGAYAFVWFLQKVNLLNITEISPQALTAITLLIAESDPKDKDKMTGLVMLLLGAERSAA